MSETVDTVVVTRVIVRTSGSSPFETKAAAVSPPRRRTTNARGASQRSRRRRAGGAAGGCDRGRTAVTGSASRKTSPSSSTSSPALAGRASWLLRQRPLEDGVDAARKPRRNLCRARDRRVEMRERLRHRSLGGVGPPPGEQLVRDDTERIAVARRASPSRHEPARARDTRRSRAPSPEGSGFRGPLRTRCRSRSRARGPRRPAGGSRASRLDARCPERVRRPDRRQPGGATRSPSPEQPGWIGFDRAPSPRRGTP